MNIKTILSRKTPPWHLPLVGLICLCLLIGGITYRDYGDSTDEAGLREYASQSLDAYKDFPNPTYGFHYVGNDIVYYGPAFVMGVELFIRIFHLPATGANAGAIWHLAFFIGFLIATICIYLLARRWMSNWSSFGITLLFVAQPLLWGQSFINPKDGPFMDFFLLSVVTGLWLADRIDPTGSEIGWDGWSGWINRSFLRIKQNYHDLPGRTKKRAGIISLLFFFSIVFLAVFRQGLNNAISILVRSAYSDKPANLLGAIFSKIAHHKATLPIENYVHKAQNLFIYLQSPYFILGLLLILWLYRACLPWSLHIPSKQAALTFLKKTGLAFASPAVLTAGLVLGLATSTRVVAPLAGLLVVLYALWKKGKSALPALLAYAIISLLVMYFTWPFLWADPIHHFIDSMRTMSNFPWTGKILFNGNMYFSTNLPWFYLPELFGIQFTEPVVLLFAAGLVISIHKLIQKKNFIFALAFIWFLLPVAFLIITHRPMYDNFRQILFLIPPIFLLAGISLDAIFQFAKKWWVRSILLLLLALPGIYWSWNLHPYEYIYYNGMVGNVEGSFKKFDLDYWMTSFYETTLFLNQAAQPNARVIVWGYDSLVKPYARPDLTIEPDAGAPTSFIGKFDYAILSSRYGQDELYPDTPPVFTVKRDGATLAVVKHLTRFSIP